MQLDVTVRAAAPEARALAARAADIADLNAPRNGVSHRIAIGIGSRENDEALGRATPQERLARVLREVLVAVADLLTVAAGHRDALLP